MVNGNHQLPDGWALKTVDELYEVIGGGTPSTSVPEYWNGDIPWITSADIAGLKDIQPRKKITQDAIANSATSCVPAGSLIVVTRVSLGKVALTSYPLCFSQDSQALIAKDKGISPEYALYYLAQATKIFKYQGRGTTISGVTKKQLKEIPFPVPPLPEQERIVAKIEELFTQLEAGTFALERVQAGLRRYKASVLKAAVEGKLLESRELENSGKLPEGWRLVKMEEIAETIGGATKGRKLEGKATITLPYLRVANVQRGRLDLEVMKEIEILKSEIEKYRLLDGDVVLTEGGDWDKLGRSAIWRNQIPNCIHQNHIFRARVKSSNTLPEWLMYFTNSEQGQDYFKESSKQTTNLASINLTQLRACPIPLPPLEEQRRIVAEVERRLSVAREVETVVEKALARSSRLRQSVLKSAYEGRLG